MYFLAEACATNFPGMGENSGQTTNACLKTRPGGAETLGMQAPREADAVDNIYREEAETTDGKEKVQRTKVQP